MTTVQNGPRLAPATIARSLWTGALCGATLVSANLLVVNLVGERPVDGPIIALIAFPVALVFWAVGLLFVGGPAWMLLHTLGLTRRWMGAMLGGASGALVLMLRFSWIEDLMDAPHGMAWSHPLANVAAFGAMGVAVGWIVVHQAYGRAESK